MIMWRSITGALALGIAALAGLPVHAQDIRGAADDQIVVTGIRPEDAAVRDTSLQFVRAALPLPKGGQYARWHTAICPKVIGLDDRLGAILANKLRRTATSVGAKVAPSDCKPNVIITFAENAGAVAGKILAKQPGQFGGLDPSDRELVLKSAMPVRWWNNTRVEAADGRALTATSTALMSAPGGGGQPFGNDDTAYGDSYSASLIDTKVRASTVTSTVLIDAGFATGYRLDAIAAHVAMAVLSQSRLSNVVDGKLSILGLFTAASDNRPTDLTRWDLAFLTALYNAPVNRSGRAQRSAIAREMIQQIVAPAN